MTDIGSVLGFWQAHRFTRHMAIAGCRVCRWSAKIEEALMVGVGGSDPMDYHALEAMQCMIERRKGGETGVAAVQLIDGDAVLASRRRRTLVSGVVGSGTFEK